MTRPSELFERLSDGTQEQIAVLVRLAMAAMLAERGQAVPVILDDALVYCDDDRIQRMFDALSRAGKHQQIIVLTCRLRTFSPLGGHTLRVRMAPETGLPLVPEAVIQNTLQSPISNSAKNGSDQVQLNS